MRPLNGYVTPYLPILTRLKIRREAEQWQMRLSLNTHRDLLLEIFRSNPPVFKLYETLIFQLVEAYRPVKNTKMGMAAIVFLRTWIRGARTLKSTFENPVEDERKTMRPLFLYLGFTKSCPVWEKFLSDFTAGSEIRKMGL